MQTYLRNFSKFFIVDWTDQTLPFQVPLQSSSTCFFVVG
jgi:hypothetical protein